MKRTTQPADRALKALFIGNSFTARNDLPGLLGRMAAAGGLRLEHRLISVGGVSLRRHWNKGDALREVREGGFDRVVLQEQSTLPIKSPQRMGESVRLFDGAIRAAGARTVLYMTWARRHAPETQAAITEAYMSLGRELGAAVIPAGVAWQEVLRLHPHLFLHDRDGSHPTVAGTYLAASAAFAVLFGRSPVGNPAAGGLTAGGAKLLQRAAYLAVKRSSSRPEPT